VTVPDGSFHHVLVTSELQPAGAADRAEVLRQGPRRGQGEGGQGPPRGVSAGQDHPLIGDARRRPRRA
jgi:hypothetical protein